MYKPTYRYGFDLAVGWRRLDFSEKEGGVVCQDVVALEWLEPFVTTDMDPFKLCNAADESNLVLRDLDESILAVLFVVYFLFLVNLEFGWLA